MRPARKGPENVRVSRFDRLFRGRFNEAGPQGAGKPAAGRRTSPGSGRFNEAGPQGAGKLPALRARIEVQRHASMRPARKGPENTNWNRPMCQRNALQ